MLVLWGLKDQDGLLIATLPEPAFSMASCPEKNRVCLGTRSGMLYEMDYRSKRLLRTWQGHSDAVFSLIYSSDGERLYSASADGFVKKWSNDSDLAQDSQQISPKNLRCLEFGTQGLWVGGSEGKLWLIDPTNLQVLMEQKVSDTSVFAIQSEGKDIFFCGRDARIHKYHNNNPEQDVNAHWYTIHALSISPDKQFLASGSMDKSIKIWEKEGLHLLKVIDRERYGAHSSSVNRIIWLDSRRFVSCSDDRMLLCFELNFTPD